MTNKQSNGKYHVGLLWIDLFWRYMIYSFGLQFICLSLLDMSPFVVTHKTLLEHPVTIKAIYGMWHAVASRVALGQALRKGNWVKQYHQ